MMTNGFISELQRIVGRSQVSVNRVESELYSYDASLAKGHPGVVVFPADTEEVSRVVQAASRADVAFVPRGFGTNLSGGTVLPSGGLVICLSRLNRILGIYPESRHAEVQPGVTNLELQSALSPTGFFYAPDPASQKVATLGGNIGENSGGPRCLKYGVTTNHVLGMDLVLADGEVIRIGGPALDPPGFDLRGVVVGSEGTFGIATEITVRITPLPMSVITMLAVYSDIGDAARSVSDIIAAGIVPTTLEMMDAPIIQAVEDSYACGYPRDAAAVLIIEVEGQKAGLRGQAIEVQEICMANGCREIREAGDDAERNRLWEGRRGAFGAVARLAPNYLVNDCTVPRTHLPQALATVAEITRKYRFSHGNVFHAGDGNLHPLIFFDSRDPDQMARVKKAGWEIMAACVALGGTISGEHGIGVEKMDAMHLVFSEDDFKAQRALKLAFDPNERLNPGKVIPPPEKAAAAFEEKIKRTVFSPLSSDSPGEFENRLLKKIRDAIAAGQPVLPVGCGTCPDWGNPPDSKAVPLASEGLDRVVDYDAPNQVVTVGAGMPLSVLQEVLRDHGQWLPVRPAVFLQKHSIGGVVALAACGPERLVYGAPRDLLLGLRFISGTGEFVSTGGRVVKNVAGYDMTRLLTGSAGTLGFITSITFRVAMLPKTCICLCTEGKLNAITDAASALFTGNLMPTFLAMTGTGVPDGGTSDSDPARWRLHVGLEGFEKTVGHQVDRAVELCEKTGLTILLRQPYDVYDGPFGPHWERIGRAPYILRVDLPQNHAGAYLTTLDGILSKEEMVVDLGCGRITAGLACIDDNRWELICRQAEAWGGHVLLEKAPIAFKQDHDVFGRARSDWQMIRRIKSALDPSNIFAPGRLPGRA